MDIEGIGRACIEVICGGMFSGKTEELIRRVKVAQIAKRKYLVFVPAMDTRYQEQADAVVSHNGTKILAKTVRTIWDIIEIVEQHQDTEIVAVDEVQFLENPPKETVEGFQTLAGKGLRVIVAGLDQDFRGLPFPPIPDLLAVAEYIYKPLANCIECGEPAGRSIRLIDGRPASFDEPTISLGGGEQYQPRCRKHHHVLINSSFMGGQNIP